MAGNSIGTNHRTRLLAISSTLRLLLERSREGEPKGYIHRERGDVLFVKKFWRKSSQRSFCRQWVLSLDPVTSGALVAIQDVVVASILFFLWFSFSDRVFRVPFLFSSLVTMDYVASFFDSRSSSWNYASLRNFNKLSSPVQSHLQKVSNKLQVFSCGFVAMSFLPLLLLLLYYMVCALLRGSF